MGKDEDPASRSPLSQPAASRLGTQPARNPWAVGPEWGCGIWPGPWAKQP